MKKRPPRIVRFPQTPRQLSVLRWLAGQPVESPWILLDRHEGKAAGTMTRVGEGTKPAVESRWDDKAGRSWYRVTDEGRLALKRAEADEAEKARRYDPFGPQSAGGRR